MVDPIALPILLQFSRFLFIHVLFFRIGNMLRKWVGFLASRSHRWSQLWMISTSAQKQPLFSISEDLRWSFRLIYPIDLSIDLSIYCIYLHCCVAPLNTLGSAKSFAPPRFWTPRDMTPGGPTPTCPRSHGEQLVGKTGCFSLRTTYWQFTNHSGELKNPNMGIQFI